MWTGTRILPVNYLCLAVFGSTQGDLNLHGLTELTWPARQRHHTNSVSFFEAVVHSQAVMHRHTQKLSGHFQEGKTAPPGAHSDRVTWNCDFHNLPRFWGLVLFSYITETCHVRRDLQFIFFRVPITCHVSSNFLKVKERVSENVPQVLFFFLFFLWTCRVSMNMEEGNLSLKLKGKTKILFWGIFVMNLPRFCVY
jgi:hypothetical protein